MPIAKKPTKTRERSESEINRVIGKGGSVAKTERAKNKKILLRIPVDLLDRVETDIAALPLNTPRNTWILEAILEKLERKKK